MHRMWKITTPIYFNHYIYQWIKVPRAFYQTNTKIGMQVKSPNKRGVEAHEVKVDVTLTKLTPLDAGWVLD